jgi:hypothetical protein
MVRRQMLNVRAQGTRRELALTKIIPEHRHLPPLATNTITTFTPLISCNPGPIVLL